MPFEARLNPEEGFVRLRGYGDADVDSSAAALADLRGLEGFDDGVPILIDARELEYLASASDVELLTQPDAVPAVLQGHPTAVLARSGAQYGVARRFATLSNIAGAVVEVFGDVDSAESWVRSFLRASVASDRFSPSRRRSSSM